MYAACKLLATYFAYSLYARVSINAVFALNPSLTPPSLPAPPGRVPYNGQWLVKYQAQREFMKAFARKFELGEQVRFDFLLLRLVLLCCGVHAKLAYCTVQHPPAQGSVNP
jgi:hypothetical protein